MDCLRHWDYLTEENNKKLDKSESLILGYDSSNGEDQASYLVTDNDGSMLTMVNVFHGEEAEWMYNRLTTK